MVKTFLLAYVQLLLLSINSRLTNREQYTGLVFVNVIASMMYCFMFADLTRNLGEPTTIVAYVSGNTLGVLSGVYLHNLWSKMEKGQMTIEAKALARYVAKRLIHFLLALTAVVTVIAFCSLIGHCQTAEPKHIDLHTDPDEWEDTLGIKLVTITGKDDRLVYYYVTRKFEQRLASMAWDSRTIFDSMKDRKKRSVLEGCYLLIYCKKHTLIYVAQQIPCKGGNQL